MYKDDAHRIAAYIAKTVPTTVGLKVAEQLTGMKSGYAAVAASIVPIEVATAQVLSGLNVPSAKWGQYFAFAREIWKREKLGGDPGLTTDAQICLNKWEAYGSTDSVMIAIGADVFGLLLT